MIELLTELDAVNGMLLTIGEQPASTLEDDFIEEVVIAKHTLAEVSRNVQAAGWHFNTVKNLQIYPNTNKEIVLPNNCLRVDTVRLSAGLDVVQQGKKLYNATDNTFEFDYPVVVDLVLLLPFDKLIQPARDYIAVKATRRFLVRTTRSTTLAQLTQQDELEALVILKQCDLDTGDYNMLWDNPLSRYTLLRDRRA